MKYMFQKLLGIFFVILLCTSVANADIAIHVMSNAHTQSIQSKQNIQSVVKQALLHDHVNIGGNSPYGSVSVELLRNNNSRYLLVHLMSRYFLSYEIMRINLNADGSIMYPVIPNYKIQHADFLAQSSELKNSIPVCPVEYQTGKPLFVIASPAYTDTSSINRSVNRLRKAIFSTGQYQLVQLLDDNATVQNYQNILACSNLAYFAHFGGSDDYGQSFALVDGDFDATYFSQNPQLNFSDKAISLDSCNLFDQVDQGFCPILKTISKGLTAYTSGSSQLLIWGSAETYACFWKKVLRGETMTQSTLQQCAVAYDPSVPHSQSGIYFVGSRDNAAKVLIQTNQRSISIAPHDYIVLKLSNGEKVVQYAMSIAGQNTICTPDPTNRITLLNNTALLSGEFILNFLDDGTCQFTEVSRLERNGNITRDIYGFSPQEQCFHLPNKPPVGTLTLTSDAGLLDMVCNGMAASPLEISGYPVRYLWQGLVDHFNHSQSLACTFSLDSAKIEIASMNIDIRPSSTLPGMLAGRISNIKTMNHYPLPTLSYSGKGCASGYHNGFAIKIIPPQYQ